MQHKEHLLYIAEQYERDVRTLKRHSVKVAQSLWERNQHQNAPTEWKMYGAQSCRGGYQNTRWNYASNNAKFFFPT